MNNLHLILQFKTIFYINVYIVIDAIQKCILLQITQKKFVLNGFVLIAKERKVYCMEAYFMELNYQSQKYFI